MTLPTLFHRHRWHPVAVRRGDDSFLALPDEINRMFEDFWRGFDVEPWGRWEGSLRGFTPSVDVEETDTELRVTAELPGLEEKDFELELHEGVLTIHGEKREEREDRKRGWTECSYGSFHREVPLPCEVDADKAEAEYKKGILKVRLPKPPEVQTRARRIDVKTA